VFEEKYGKVELDGGGLKPAMPHMRTTIFKMPPAIPSNAGAGPSDEHAERRMR
jgi:hypothetical protein